MSSTLPYYKLYKGMAMASEALSEFGLTDTECRVLESLIAAGESTGSALAAKLGMHKSVAYFVLEQLVHKGLAGFVVVNKRRQYRPLEPQMMRARLEARKKEFLKKFESIQALLQAAQKKTKRPFFSIFEGWDGMKTAFNDIIISTKPSEEYLVFVVDPPEKLLNRFRRFIKKFHNRRASKGIRCKLLVSSRLRSTIGKDRKGEPHTTVRFVSSEDLMPMAVNVYASKILLSVWTDPPMAIIIESKEVSDSFRAVFRNLWGKAAS